MAQNKAQNDYESTILLFERLSTVTLSLISPIKLFFWKIIKDPERVTVADLMLS